jgi:putative transposase
VRQKDEEWALFWCTLLHPAIFGEIEPKQIHSFLKKLAAEERLFPNGMRKKPSLSTLRRKLRTYREEGFEALARKPRADRGRSRAHRQELIDKAIELKRDQPKRSDETINQFLRIYCGETLPKSSLYRYLRSAGATRLKLGIDLSPVRCRWTREHTHDLWLGDFEDGPYVLYLDEVVPTHLSAFIDCYSRDVVEGRYYYRQNLDILIDSLLRAWAIHGAPSDLYLDNAKVYLSHALRRACYQLNINLIHRKPRDPSPGGLIERIFGTAQSQFEAEVRAGEILTLEQLNQAFAAWLEMSYRRRPHSETGQPPRERYQQGLTVIRQVDMEVAHRAFMSAETRRVHRDFSDIQLNRRFYRVDPSLRGDRLLVHYDPFSDPETVLLYSLDDERYLGKGQLHHREQGHIAPELSPRPKPKHNYLELLKREHEKELRKKTQGIDYRSLPDRPWPFPAWAKAIAHLLGFKGGLSAFNAAELETLHKLYRRLPEMTEAQLRDIFAAAPEKSLPGLLQQLRQLATQRKET